MTSSNKINHDLSKKKDLNKITTQKTGQASIEVGLSKDVLLSGLDTQILMLDSGIDGQISMDGCLRHLTHLEGHSAKSERGDSHAMRGASIFNELAPNAKIISALYRPFFPDRYYSLLKDAFVKFGRVDIVSHAYSANENWDLAVRCRELMQRLVDVDEEVGCVHIAAAGHAGKAGVRFPATAANVLAIGVATQDKKLASYCGVSGQKPELAVADKKYRSILENGEQSTLGGTSAAVAIAAGVAALWIERIRKDGFDVNPMLIRAAMLACSKKMNETSCRLIRCPVEYSYISWKHLSQKVVRINIRQTQPHSSLCIAVRYSMGSIHFAPKGPRISVVYKDSGKPCANGIGFVVLDAVKEGIYHVEVSGLASEVVAFACNATVKRERAYQLHKRRRVIVGISASHDASAAVLIDGKLERAIQLERLTRIKHEGLPLLHTSEAIEYCLNSLEIRPDEVEAFGFNIQPIVPGYAGLSQPTFCEGFDIFDPFSDRSFFVSHHLCHAYAAYFASGYKKALAIVADGSGGTTLGENDLILLGKHFFDYLHSEPLDIPPLHTLSAYEFEHNGFRLIDRETSPSFNVRCGSSSLGETYAAVSQYIFGDWKDGAGKLMGLAPYGDKNKYPSFLKSDQEMNLSFSSKWKEDFRDIDGNKDPMKYRDLAARIQRDLEIALLQRFRKIISKTKYRNIVYSGGIALNSVANEKLIRQAKADNFFIYPASNDAGIAVGAAAAAWAKVSNKKNNSSISSDFHGHKYSNFDYSLALKDYSHLINIAPFNLEKIAESLANGEILGCFDGASEFGPRALGHRSILADPRDEKMWIRLNKEVKFREEFRPFAPVVPIDRAEEYFDIIGESPYMLRVVKVRPKWRKKLNAITHIDGSARIQTVDHKRNPFIYEILTKFAQLTNIPILINTSLNVKGEPIVENPRDAIELMLSTNLDALILGEHIVRRIDSSRLSEQHQIQLNQSCHLVSKSDGFGQYTYLLCEARGSQPDEIKPWLFDLLSTCGHPQQISELLNSFLPYEIDRSYGLSTLKNLCKKKAILIVGKSKEVKPKKVIESWKFLTPNDRKVVSLESGRTCKSVETLHKIELKKRLLGVTRVADVTGYDNVGIPVFTATCPDVSKAQISATQGKGLTRVQARTSALMELAERRAAASASPELVASEAELKNAGMRFISVEVLGGQPTSNPIEWVEGRYLEDERPVLLPAAEVLYPYNAPTGIERGFRPTTTGLASGNTLAEAILYGILEVIERDAVSRHCFGTRAKLLNLKSIKSGPEHILLSRFSEAGVDIAAFKLEACLPVYISTTYCKERLTPPLLISGQGCSFHGRIALRRSLLEAAQSRVVAIQGSREDLVRHASKWGDSYDSVLQMYKRGIELARGYGTIDLSEDPDERTSITDSLLHVQRMVSHQIIYVDLTDKTVDIPVVHVSIPGMVDSISDPNRKPK